uniref:Uncharacterized protein n=1 Tax=Nelumbo nucifera TaxID=4432 RepID=A0A822YIZ5_NELNU|nr:TPA_asm: hypothetical protein HUJ06_030826 [Nelumbo nucifera]
MSNTPSILNAAKRPSKKKRKAGDSSHTLAMEQESAERRSVERERELVNLEEEGGDLMYVNPTSYCMLDPIAHTVMPHVPTPEPAPEASNSHGSTLIPHSHVITTNRIWDPHITQWGGGILVPEDVQVYGDQPSPELNTKMIQVELKSN